jgi:hypothetical protein
MALSARCPLHLCALCGKLRPPGIGLHEIKVCLCGCSNMARRGGCVAPVGMVEDAIVVPRAGGRGEYMVQGALRHSTSLVFGFLFSPRQPYKFLVSCLCVFL